MKASPTTKPLPLIPLMFCCQELSQHVLHWADVSQHDLGLSPTLQYDGMPLLPPLTRRMIVIALGSSSLTARYCRPR
jgi:hypothetical protein